MSGRNDWRELAKPIDEDPARRARVEELGRAYDALLAGADAGLSDEELEELAEDYGLVSDPRVRESVQEAEAEIDRGEGLSFREAFGEELRRGATGTSRGRSASCAGTCRWASRWSTS